MSTIDRPRSWHPESGPTFTSIERVTLAARQLRRLRVSALAEATTLILLVGVAVPLKHLGDWPFAVRFLGPIHGFAFVAYVWLVLQSLGAGLLSRSEALRLATAAFVPVAGFFTIRFLTRRIAERLHLGAQR